MIDEQQTLIDFSSLIYRHVGEPLRQRRQRPEPLTRWLQGNGANKRVVLRGKYPSEFIHAKSAAPARQKASQ